MPIQRTDAPEEKYVQGTLFEEETPEEAPNVVETKLRSGMDLLQKTLKSTGGADYRFTFSEEEKLVLFLTEAINTYFQHWVEYTDENGKARRRPYTCAKWDAGKCPLCDAGVDAKLNADFLVLYVHNEGGAWVETPQVMTVTPMPAETLININADPRKGPLPGKWFQVTRTGKGRTTLHHFDFVKKRDLEEDYGLPTDLVEKYESEWVGKTDFYKPWPINMDALEEAARTLKAQ